MSATVDLQGVLGRFLPAYRARYMLTSRQGQVCAHLRDCRTPALGTLHQTCAACGYQPVRYLSCRDRHCPKCQGRASAQLCERRSEDLLPVTYYHLVFTLPESLNGWVALNHEALFASTWSTLSAFVQAHFGGRLGMSAVLHTWGEQLTRHVHLHCLIPGGALDEEGAWPAARGEYLFPVRAVSRRLRGNVVAGLRRRAESGELSRVTHPGSTEGDANLPEPR